MPDVFVAAEDRREYHDGTWKYCNDRKDRRRTVGFVRCIVYLALLGAVCFILGRLLPKSRFRWDRFPYKSAPWERGGAAYHRLGIRCWQSRIPDMSRILPGVMPAKKMTGRMDAGALAVMLRETCVAELIHVILCIGGFYCVRLWPGPGGWVASVLYCVGNLPFVLVQRYNRPRLAKLLQRTEQREKRGYQ